jgi:hypothetical protein
MALLLHYGLLYLVAHDLPIAPAVADLHAISSSYHAQATADLRRIERGEAATVTAAIKTLAQVPINAAP